MFWRGVLFQLDLRGALSSDVWVLFQLDLRDRSTPKRKLNYTNSDALLEFSNELPTDDYKILYCYGVKDDVYLFKI